MLKELPTSFYESRHKKHVGFAIGFLSGIIIKGYNMSITIRNDQEVTLTPVFKDKSGNPVTVLGSVPAWTVSDENIATLDVAEDGLSAVVTFKGTLGEVLVNMVVDADPDASVVEVAAQQHIIVIAGMGVDVTLDTVVTDVVPVEVAVPVAEPVPEVTAEPAPVEATPVVVVPADPIVTVAPVVTPVEVIPAPVADVVPVAVVPTEPAATIPPVEVSPVVTTPADPVIATPAQIESMPGVVTPEPTPAVVVPVEVAPTAVPVVAPVEVAPVSTVAPVEVAPVEVAPAPSDSPVNVPGVLSWITPDNQNVGSIGTGQGFTVSATLLCTGGVGNTPYNVALNYVNCNSEEVDRIGAIAPDSSATIITTALIINSAPASITFTTANSTNGFTRTVKANDAPVAQVDPAILAS